MRVDATIIDAAVGGSKSGPPIVAVHVNAPSGIILRVAHHASHHGAHLVSQKLDDRAVEYGYPLFYPANAKDQPPTIAIESQSDSHLKSMRDEAVRVWDHARADMDKRVGWLHTLGAHPCLGERLLEPFSVTSAVLIVPNEVEEFMCDLINDLEHPDVRILGYRLAVRWLTHHPKRVTRHREDFDDQFVVRDGRWVHMRCDPPTQPLADLLLERPSWAA